MWSSVRRVIYWTVGDYRWEDLFTMFCYFAPVTRHSFQAMCTVFSRKDFSELFDGLLRISTRKTNAEPRCLTSLGGHDGAIWAAKHLDLVHVHYLANPYTDLTNSLRGTKYFLRETNTVFRDTNNSLWGTKYFLWETNAVFRGTANPLRGTFGETNYLRDGNRNLGYEKIVNTTVHGYFYLTHAYMYLRSVPGLQYDNIHTGNTNVSNDLLVNTVKLTVITIFMQHNFFIVLINPLWIKTNPFIFIKTAISHQPICSFHHLMRSDI